MQQQLAFLEPSTTVWDLSVCVCVCVRLLRGCQGWICTGALAPDQVQRKSCESSTGFRSHPIEANLRQPMHALLLLWFGVL